MTTTFEHIRTAIAAGRIGTAEFWLGADVKVLDEQPPLGEPGFYPDPLFVVTPHAGELSWLFEQVRDCVMNTDGYGALKLELFGEMGQRAIQVTAAQPDIEAKDLLLAVLDVPELMIPLFDTVD